MILHSKTRRNATMALIGICSLVCAGLTWATFTAIRLEEIESHSAHERAAAVQEKSNYKTLALALAHLDGFIDSVLAIERTRPFEHYRAFYKPASALNAHSGLPAEGDFLVESPLHEPKSPDWVLLHFQVSGTHDWSSPQLERDIGGALPASAFPALDRAKQASAENWLAALRDHADPFVLLQKLEAAREAEIERGAAIDRIGGIPAAPAPAVAREVGDAGPEPDRTAAEFARRGQRLLEMQRIHLPAEQCEPWDVAIENLQTGAEAEPELAGGATCVKVWGTPMQPVWLDLTLDATRQLAMVRSVSVEQLEFCTLQGVLIDWEKLRRTLESEIQDMLPGARIEPVEVGTAFDPSSLRTIPARIVGLPVVAMETIPRTLGLEWGLVLTWSATLLALSAIAWGTMKYVGMIERRMQFVAAVTHELRTPLTSFQLYTDLLSDMGDDPVKRSQYIETLRRESMRLARLVENVLGYSRIGDASPRLNRTLVSPQSVLDAIRLQTQEQCAAAEKQLVMQNRCEPGYRINTDAEFVVQILANLIENACKYSTGAADPRIWLTAGPRDEGGIVFEVEDRGAGIALADRKAVFKPFRRSSDARAHAAGMGLGLTLSRYWAACLGGRLELQRGEHDAARFTRFSLSLPPGDASTAPALRPAPAR